MTGEQFADSARQSPGVCCTHMQGWRRNAKRGQDQLDSIDFIGKNSAATFLRVNFNQRTLNSGGGALHPAEGQEG